MLFDTCFVLQLTKVYETETACKQLCLILLPICSRSICLKLHFTNLRRRHTTESLRDSPEYLHRSTVWNTDICSCTPFNTYKGKWLKSCYSGYTVSHSFSFASPSACKCIAYPQLLTANSLEGETPYIQLYMTQHSRHAQVHTCTHQT